VSTPVDVEPPCRRDADGRWARVWHDRLDHVRGRTSWLVQVLRHQYRDDH
jgi:hypothetical protein